MQCGDNPGGEQSGRLPHIRIEVHICSRYFSPHRLSLGHILYQAPDSIAGRIQSYGLSKASHNQGRQIPADTSERAIMSDPKPKETAAALSGAVVIIPMPTGS
jgi:hypothetical protein